MILWLFLGFVAAYLILGTAGLVLAWIEMKQGGYVGRKSR